MGGGEAYVAQIRRMMESCGAAVAVAPDGYLDLLNRAARPLSLVLAGSAGDFDALPEAEELPQPLAGDEPPICNTPRAARAFRVAWRCHSKPY